MQPRWTKLRELSRMPFIAHHQMPEVPKAGEEPHNLPTAPIPAERTAILGLGAFPAAPMGRNHLDAQMVQRGIQRIGVIGAIANEALRQGIYETESKVGATSVTCARA
jgi:hypothetical protein